MITAANMYLIFSNVDEKFFLGYAKIHGEPDEIKFINDELEDLMNEEYLKKNMLEKFVRIEWCFNVHVGFEHFQDVNNPLNQNKPVNYSKEIQEVEANCAKRVMEIISNYDETDS